MDQDLGEVALRCMCELLVCLPHFNFRNNILVAVVPRMTSRSLAGKVCGTSYMTSMQRVLDGVYFSVAVDFSTLLRDSGETVQRGPCW